MTPSQPKLVTSSIIEQYEYDAKKYILKVWWKTGKNTGVPTQYLNVFPSVISNVFDQPGSVGSKFLKQIHNAGYLNVREMGKPQDNSPSVE